MAGNKYPEILKKKIVDDYNAGLSRKALAAKYNICYSTIWRITKLSNTTASLKTIHAGGRLRRTSIKEDRRIAREIKKDPFISSRNIRESLSLEISTRTICRRAVESGLKAYRQAKKPFISLKNRRARLEFAKEHVDWSKEKWMTVLFSDESKFNFKGSDGNQHVRRPRGERLNPLYTRGTVKFGGGNVMVWGCFSAHGVGPIHKVEGIMDRFQYKDILEDVMLPYAEDEMPLAWIFQQDNDPKHTAKVVKEWFSSAGVNVMKWPAQSPDLNPIENLWQIVDRRITRTNTHNKDALFAQVKEAWESVPNTHIQNLIDSMPRRCRAVIKSKGFSIKY